jgi:PBP1b-binding outer membrane lipoprotein LpoB
MKKILNYSFATMLALFFAGAVSAQPPSAEERAKRDNEWMKTSLSLTDEQVPKVEAINLKYANKMSELFQQGGGNFEEIRPKMTELQGQKRTELQAVLTTEQLKLYDKTLEEQRANRQGPPR